MQLRNLTTHPALWARVATVLICSMLVVGCLQDLIITALKDYDMSTHATDETDRRRSAGRSEGYPVHDTIRYLPDGTMHFIDVIMADGGGALEPKGMTVYNSEGKLLWTDRGNQQSPYKYVRLRSDYAPGGIYYSPMHRWTVLGELSRRLPLYRTLALGSFSTRLIVSVHQPLAGVNEFWAYDSTDQCFRGYGPGDKTLGYLGSAGLADSPAKAGPLGEVVNMWPCGLSDMPEFTLIWRTEHRVYRICPAKRSVEVLFDSPVQ